MASSIKEKVSTAFKMHGMIPLRATTTFLVETLQTIPIEEHKSWLEKVIEVLHGQNLECSIVELSDIQKAVSNFNNDAENSGTEKFIIVIDAFSIPKFSYDKSYKMFVPVDLASRDLFGDTNSKASVFLGRYDVVLQRIMRHDIFRPVFCGQARNQQEQRFSLKPIEFLLASSGSQEDVIVLGMLTQLKEGCYYLEDPTGHVKLDLTKAEFQNGFFTENCFVLVEGTYEDALLRVKAVGLPPSEPSRITRNAFGNINFFGGPSLTSVKSSAKLKELEESNVNDSIVFIADVWFDDSKVIDKLRHLFMGLSDYPPTCFVFMGNFISMQQNSNQPEMTTAVATCFSKLADLIQEFPLIARSSKLVFVPGFSDPGLSVILPRPPIPACITESFRARFPNAVFTTNPCRIQYCTQEIVIFREDLVSKMSRNCVRFPGAGDAVTHLVKVIVSQNHLYPMPLHVAPTYWEYDHAMNVYPLPDLLVLADRHSPYQTQQCECNIINPGSFSRNGFVFKVYVPATRQVEDSQVKDD